MAQGRVPFRILWVLKYSTRNGSLAVKRQKSADDGLCLVAGKRIPVLTGNSFAPVQNISIYAINIDIFWYGTDDLSVTR